MKVSELSGLARDGSAQSTGVLVAALTDLFCQAKAEERERVSQLFGEVVVRVLGRLEVAAREILSKRICAHAGAPKDLVCALATDEELTVAAPVLEQSPILEDDDLAKIAGSISGGHLQALCRRGRLSREVTRVVALAGEQEVLHSLARNHAAHLGPNSFDLLVARSRKDEELQIALSERADLPAAAAERLVPFLSRELAQRIKDLGDNEVLVKAIAERAAREVEIQLREFKGAKSKTEQLIDGALAGKVPIEQIVTVFAEKDRAFDLGQLLARKIGWPDNAVVSLVFREDDQPLMLLCRFANVSDEVYEKVVRMRAKRMRLSSSTSREALHRYRLMTEEAMRPALKALALKMKMPAPKF
ncbi:DUF2336 domain-containing protein [Stappia indica]|uniref:DUF2336 domain-containing protein n=1 Tax=Stappia indica TaxID=538381 RepID=UPI001CD80A88|nr:DUF2336 domain-containing protein [Stappia indica]MCA1298994.1 DUF2336 domain-containing protein [Stappia indica]